MRKIMLLNAKGGCGKSTLATNLASYYASQGKAVVIADFDRQGSSMEWIEQRPQDRPPITGVDVHVARMPKPSSSRRFNSSGISGSVADATTAAKNAATKPARAVRK